jgi:hypothetical protein
MTFASGSHAAEPAGTGGKVQEELHSLIPGHLTGMSQISVVLLCVDPHWFAMRIRIKFSPQSGSETREPDHCRSGSLSDYAVTKRLNNKNLIERLEIMDPEPDSQLGSGSRRVKPMPIHVDPGL